MSLNKNSVTQPPVLNFLRPGLKEPWSSVSSTLVSPQVHETPHKAPRLREKRMRCWASLDLANPKMDTKPGALPTQELLRKTRTHKTSPFTKTLQSFSSSQWTRSLCTSVWKVLCTPSVAELFKHRYKSWEILSEIKKSPLGWYR